MSIVWAADATQAIEREWASMSTTAHCNVITYAGLADTNIYQIADPTALHGRSYRAEINALSNSGPGCWTSGIREEINMGNPTKTMYDGIDRTYHEGQERWISIQFKLDPTFPTHATYRGSSVFQFHPAVQDGGLFNLGAGGQTANTGDQWEIWGYQGAAPGNANSFQAPLGDLLSTRGKWVRFTFHVLFSSVEPPAGPAVGFFECYSDVKNPGGLATLPLLYSKYNVATMKSGRAYHFQTFGFYPAVKPITDFVAMNMCGLTCSTDRASAEANAFGTGAPPPPPPPGPVAAFTTTPSAVNTGQLVTFDASASTGSAPLSYKFTDAASGAVLGTQKIQPFTFQFAGTKLATLLVTDGLGATGTVEHDLVVSVAAPPTFPQADLRSPPILVVGNDYFARVRTRLPANLPTAGFVSMRFAAIDGPPTTAGPPISLGLTVSASAIHWCLQRGADYSNDIVWIGPVVNNAWHTFILHVNMMADTTGYIELWMDGAKQTFTSAVQTLQMITYGAQNNGGANWLDVQCYRGSGWLAGYVQGTAQGGTTTAGTLTIYHGQPAVGLSFAAV